MLNLEDEKGRKEGRKEGRKGEARINNNNKKNR